MKREGHFRSPSSPLPTSVDMLSTEPDKVAKPRPRRTLLAALAPVLILSATQVARLSKLRTYPDQSPKPHPRRLGLVNFVDNEDEHLWGVYSIHKQMKKFHMTPTIEHFAVVNQDISKKSRNLLQDWLGEENVRQIDDSFVLGKVHKSLKENRQDFSKIEAFNMTEYDRLILMDPTVLIRQNLEHWFDYPAPAATQVRGTLEWNDGAMVIDPNMPLYRKFLKHVSSSRTWDPKHDEGKNKDTWNSGDDFQGLMSSLLLSDVTTAKMFTMRFASSITSSDLEHAKPNWYYWRHRNWVIETVNFDEHLPWVKGTSTHRPGVCDMLHEWFESVSDAPKNKLPKLPDVFKECPEGHKPEDS